MTADKQYIFVMYTTQKSDFLKKAIEDIDKCFDKEKTGISADDVAEIIYCHTYGRLRPGDDQQLRTYCEDRGAVLTLIGIDKLGNDIFREHPILAKDFLGISIDSGQILPLDIFVAKHDANKMSAPLGTEFLHRKEEVEKAKAALYSSDVLLIAGPAGVGKTRFALELCQQLTKEKNYVVLVIKSNNLELYEDLMAAIEEGKDYLVLVDDANELSGLHHVLDYLPGIAAGSRHIAKLILTVRDYARKQAIQSVMEVTRPETIKITPFKDDEICKLMETCYGITNRLYMDRIVAIAEGNARLAMLAGKLAAESENLDVIQDVSDLYYNYYQNQLNALVISKTGVCSAGIIAFVQSIHLEHLENLALAFDRDHPESCVNLQSSVEWEHYYGGLNYGKKERTQPGRAGTAGKDPGIAAAEQREQYGGYPEPVQRNDCGVHRGWAGCGADRGTWLQQIRLQEQGNGKQPERA